MSDIFFDFGATNNGDGTTAAQAAGAGATGAYNTTDGVSPGVDTWWVRRDGTQKTIATGIVPVSGLAICGWPKSGDENYADRPASGTTNGWDSDSEDYGEIYKLSSPMSFTATTVSQLNGFYLSRMKFVGNGSTGGIIMSGRIRGARYYKCEFVNLATSATYKSATISGINVTVQDCTFRGDATNSSLAHFAYLQDSHVDNCDFDFAIDLSYNLRCIWSNIRLALNGDYLPSAAIDIGNMDYCRLENFTIDNSGYTGASASVLVSGVAHDYNTMDIQVKGNYTTIGHTGIGNMISYTPITSGDTIDFTVITLTSTDSSFTFENFDGNSVSVNNNNTTIFMKNCTIPDNSFTITNINRGALYSLNHGGVDGYWKSFGSHGIIESSDVYRTGGSAHSLRCMLEEDNNEIDIFPRLGHRDYGEVIYLDLATGTHTVTVYGSHRLFADALTKGEIWIEMDWVDSDGIAQTVSSIRGGALETDTSGWVGDTDLTQFKIEQDITIPTDQQVPVRILGSYEYENTAYIYIDPVPVVT